MDYKKIIANEISKSFDVDKSDLEVMLEVPSDEAMGDYALPCFKLAKFFKKAPPIIANDIFEKFESPEEIEKHEVKGGYLNFFINKNIFIKSVLDDSSKIGYGGSKDGAGKKIVIDYSSINIAKPFHIGHIMSTSIGNSLYRIYNHHGYEAIGINHLGDWGTQFGKLIYAYEKWGSKEDVDKRGIDSLLDLYIKFHDESEKDTSLDDEGRAWFKKIEDGDEYAVSLLDWFTDITLKRVKKIYDQLGVKFDYYTGERFYNDKMTPVIDELDNKNLLIESEGARVVDLEQFNLPPCIIVKTDGTTLYSTRDLAAAFYRKETFDFEKALYVVAYQQNLHFKQWFKVVGLMGYEWENKLEHINFGMVSLEDGTLSTRKGKIVFLEDVLNKAVEKTAEIIETKNPELEDKYEVAKKVGIGAVVFSVLSQGRIKDVTFSWDRVLNFEGETGPYMQYTYVRCNSLIQRGSYALNENPDYSALNSEEAFKTAKAISKFPNAVKTALDKNEPYLVTKSIIDIAKAFNKFYFEHKIIDEDKAKSAARLSLAKSVKSVIKIGLYLIGVETPEKM
jgi:arginyl-tRNA synthetase